MKTPVKVTLGLLLGLPLLLILLGVLLTRDVFLRSVVLPRAGAALEADLSASSIRLNPFSSLELQAFSFRKHDESLDLSLSSLRLEFSLRRLLRGQTGFDLLEILDPVITARVDPAADTPPAGKPEPAAAPPGLHMAIGEVRIRNGRVRVITPEQTLTLNPVAFSLRNLVTDLPAAVSFSADATLDLGEAGLLQARADLESEVTIGPDLLPKSFLVQLETAILRAEGSFKEIADLSSLTLQMDATPTTLRLLQFSAHNPAGQSLGRIEASGPFDPAARNADLSLSVRDIEPALLNLLGAPAGMRFGDTRLTADARLQLANGGSLLLADASLEGTSVQVKTAEFESPPVHLVFKTDLSVDLSAQTAELRELRGTLRDPGEADLVVLQLDRPTRVAWSDEPPRFDDTALSLTLNHLHAADWKAFLPPELGRGSLSGRLDLGVARQGLDLHVHGTLQVEDLSLNLGKQSFESLNLSLETRASFAELKTLQIESLNLNSSHRGQPLAQLQGRGTVETATGEAQLASQFRVNPVTLLALLPEPPPDLTLREAMLTGTLDLHMPSFNAPPALTPALTLLIRDGRFQDTDLQGLRLRLNAEAEPGGDHVTLNLQFALDQLQTPGAEAPPLIVPPFNLQGSLRASPEEVDLRELILSWPETADADNRLHLSGPLNFSNPRALVFDLALNANRVDLSPWFPQTDAAESAAAADPAPAPQTEPDPVTLPVQNGTLRVNIASILLHGLHVDALEMDTQLTPEGIDLSRLALNIAEAPLTASASVDVRVPGFRYEARARLAPLSLAPVIQALAPEHAGMLYGILEADFALAGAGLTGPSLRSNLDGHLNLLLSDSELNLRSLAELEQPVLKTFANVLISLFRALAPALGTQSSELIDAHLAEVRFNSRIGDGRIDLDTFRAGTPLVRLQSSGRIDLSDDLEASPIRNLPVQIALDPSLARRARLFREDRLRDGLIALPPFVQIAGTLGEPDVDIRRTVLAGLIVGGVTESGLLRDERAREVLGGIGGLLTGEGPRPTPTPAPQPTPAATPEPPPATETPRTAPTPRPSGRTDRILRGIDRVLGPEAPPDAP